MKTRLLTIMGISCTTILILFFLNYSIDFWENERAWMFCEHILFSGEKGCKSFLIVGHDTVGEKKDFIDEDDQLQNIMIKKATLAFDIKLDEYQYSVDQLTVQEGARTGTSTNKFFMAEAVTTNGTRYFLMTTFESEQSMDTIDVEIFEIISEKCTHDDILDSSGCEPKYLSDAVKDTSQGKWIELDVPQVEHFCANIGFEKYPDNLFAQFLENPHNKDVTFLNFTGNDLKHIPEFYELILEAEQMDYPLNKKVHFDMSHDEILVLRDYLEHRPYFAFFHSGETLTDQIGARNEFDDYRYPNILIDGNLYRIGGINFSPIVPGQTESVSVSLRGTLQEIKESFIERNNPNNPDIYYFEINEEDKISLAAVLNATSQIQKSKDKIRMSEDVGGALQDKSQDFFMEQNIMQFNNDDTKYTRYFILNETLYETSFTIC